MAKKNQLVKTTNAELVPSKEALRAEAKETLKLIEKKLKKLGGSSNTQFKTNCTFKMNDLDGNTVNLSGNSNVDYLIKALGKMLRLKKEYASTTALLKLTTYPVPSWCGQSIDHWIHDLTLRISIVTNAEQIKHLQEYKARLESFATEEDRLATTIAGARNHI